MLLGQQFKGSGRGFDMHQDVGDPADGVFYFAPDGSGDGVRLANGHVGIDFQMKIDVVFQAGAAGEALLDADRTGDGESGDIDLLHHGGFRHGVHQLIDSAADDADGQEKDNDADKHAADVIGCSEAEGIGEGEADGEESNGGGEQVGDVVPGVGEKRRAGDAAAGAEFESGESAFNEDGGDQRIQSVAANGLTLGQGCEAMPEDRGGGQQQDGSDSEAGEDLVAAMAVGMFAVGGLAGHPESGIDNGGRKDIGARFDTVGDNCGGTGSETDPDLTDGKQNTDGDAEQRDAAADTFFIERLTPGAHTI